MLPVNELLCSSESGEGEACSGGAAASDAAALDVDAWIPPIPDDHPIRDPTLAQLTDVRLRLRLRLRLGLRWWLW